MSLSLIVLNIKTLKVQPNKNMKKTITKYSLPMPLAISFVMVQRRQLPVADSFQWYTSGHD